MSPVTRVAVSYVYYNLIALIAQKDFFFAGNDDTANILRMDVKWIWMME